MTSLLEGQAAVWAIVLVVFLPITIIGMGEIEERLRQRDSPFTRVASILRVWTIPLFAILALLRGMLNLEDSRLVVRLIGTAFVLSIAAAGLVLLRIIVARFEKRTHVDSDERGLPRILLALPRLLLILAVGWILLEGVWGVDLSAAIAALGVTSLIISLALQDTLSGLASGLLLLSDAPFQPGDWIKAVDIEGRVEDINWRSSRIRDRNGDLYIVPNANLAAAEIVNYYQPEKLHRIVVTVQVAYSNPPTLAKEMLLDAARSTPGVLEEPPPDVKVVTVDDPLMTYDIQMWIDDHKDSPRIRSDFGSLVWYASHRHDVPLPSPAYDLYMYDGVRTTEESKPTRAEVRRRICVSPLISQLDEADIDRFAADARPMRFARGEVIIGGGASSRDLYVLAEGAARIVVTAPDGVTLNIAELATGEVFGVIGTAPTRQERPRVVAVTDCEVVVIDEAVAAEVASRNPELSTVFNRVVKAWERRLDRMLESYATSQQEEPKPPTEAGAQ